MLELNIYIEWESVLQHWKLKLIKILITISLHSLMFPYKEIQKQLLKISVSSIYEKSFNFDFMR